MRVRLPRAVFGALQRRAQASATNPSAVVRGALVQHLLEGEHTHGQS